MSVEESPVEECSSLKRQDYLEWDEFLMAFAIKEAARSSRNKAVINTAAVIVDSYNVIEGVAKTNQDEDITEDCKTHVVYKAIDKSRNAVTLYVTEIQCEKCALKIATETSIKRVVFLHSSPKNDIIKTILEENGVTFSQFQSDRMQREIIIDLTKNKVSFQ